MTPDEAHHSGLAPGTRPCKEEQHVPHLVKYTKADGQTGDHEVDELHDAIAYVERLRNEERAESARIFRVEEVIFEFKAYYRVELGGTSSLAIQPPAVAPTPAPSPAPAEDLAAPPLWEPPAESTPVAEQEAPSPVLTAEIEPAPVMDPWADAPPPPALAEEVETAGANGRRGLFGR
jgi:hypothetical protein